VNEEKKRMRRENFFQEEKKKRKTCHTQGGNKVNGVGPTIKGHKAMGKTPGRLDKSGEGLWQGGEGERKKK